MANKNGDKIPKFTLRRSKEDIEKLEQVRRQLNLGMHNEIYHTDSSIYKDLPELYLHAIKKQEEMRMEIDELKSEMAVFEELFHSITRVIQICTPGEKQ